MLARRAALAVVLLAAPLTVAALPASAQAVVLVMDQEKIMADSRAGKDMDQKLAAIATAMDNELKPEDDRLRTERQAIATATQNLTAEQVQARPDLTSRINAFNAAAVAQEQKRAKRGRELQETQRNALSAFFQAQQGVLQAIVTERNATAVLEASRVVWNAPGADITADFIARLDRQTPTITVTRVTLPDPPARAAAPR
jgi:outer membrane protein